MIQSMHKYVSRVRLTPVKAARAFCLKKCALSPKEVRLCSSDDCPLYAYRMGKNPSRSGVRVGQRGQRGQFLPRSAHSNGDNSIISPREGVDVGATASVDSGSINGSCATSQIEIAKGQIRIKKTGNELLIRLTQEA